jgi:hypothetical protein
MGRHLVSALYLEKNFLTITHDEGVARASSAFLKRFSFGMDIP